MCGLGDDRWSHAERSILVCTTIWNGFSLCNHWETFTSNGVSSSSSSSIGATRGFEGIIASSAMIESSRALTKTKWVAETIWYLCLEGVDAFYLTN